MPTLATAAEVIERAQFALEQFHSSDGAALDQAAFEGLVDAVIADIDGTILARVGAGNYAAAAVVLKHAEILICHGTLLRSIATTDVSYHVEPVPGELRSPVEVARTMAKQLIDEGWTMVAVYATEPMPSGIGEGLVDVQFIEGVESSDVPASEMHDILEQWV